MKAYYSVLLNLCFPGLGHYYLAQKTKAFVFCACVFLSFFIGLALDFDYYYRYEDIKPSTVMVVRNQNKPLNKGSQFKSVNAQWDEKVSLHNFTTDAPQNTAYFGHTRPGLTLEILNETTGTKLQTQADYKGFFTFPALEFAEGENRLSYGAANDYKVKQTGMTVHVSDYGQTARYRPGTLEKIWHFIYHMVFPVLTTPVLHLSGGAFQGAIINWWDSFPIVKNEKTIPAPLRDVGFYFIVLACMLNLIILFDGFDTSYNKENFDDIP